MSHIRQDLVVILDARGLKRLQRIHRHDPRADAGAEILRVERPERHHLPPLYIPRRPIIHQDQAEDILLRLLDRHGLSHLVPLAQEGPELQLKVQPLRRLKERLRDVGRRILPDRAVRGADRRARDDDRGRSAVVADGQVRVVGVEGVIDAADQSAGVDSVVLADEEVGVVAYAEG